MSALFFGTFNLGASVSIILVNKQIVSVCHFNFLLALLTLNFFTTASFLEVLVQCHIFEVKQLPPGDRWFVACLAVLTVLLNNASNEANSVGFYQITKLLIIPMVILIERLSGKRRLYSAGIVCSLCVASFGVAVATVSDFEVNARGSVLAVLSILATAQYQIWQGSKQHEHGLSPMQITHSVTVPQSVIGLGATLLLDVCCPWIKGLVLLPSDGLLEHTFRGREDGLWIAGCCIVAVLMNVSTYGLLGAVSPVTYQVIGQLKTCLIVGFGYLFFDAKGPPFWLLVRFGGVGIAAVGIIAYALLKAEEQKRKA